MREWRIILLSIWFSFLTYFPGGFISVTTNTPKATLIEFLNQSLNEVHHHPISTDQLNLLFSVLVSIYALGEFIGAFFAATLSDKFGRKIAALVVTGCFLLVGSLLMAISKVTLFELLIIGRFICGISFGISRPVTSIYLMECAFPSDRGMALLIPRFIYCSGLLLSLIFGIDPLLGNNNRWPFLMGITSFIGLASLISSCFLPESPKFLYIIKENSKKAQKSIRAIYGQNRASSTIGEFEALLNLEETKVKPVTLRKIWTDRRYRRCSIISLFLSLQRNITGSTFIITYSTYIFGEFNLHQKTAQILTVGCGCMFFGGTIAAIPMIKKCSRRRSYFVTASITLITLLLLTVCGCFIKRQAQTDRTWPVYISIAAIIVFHFFEGAGASAIGHAASIEILPMEIRAKMAAFSAGVFVISSFVVRLIVFLIYTKIFNWVYLLYVVILSLSMIYLYFKMPETNGRRLDQIMEDMFGGDQYLPLYEDQLQENNNNFHVSYGAVDQIDDTTSTIFDNITG